MIRLNGRWEATAGQPVFTREGWKDIASVTPGQQVMSGDGMFIEVSDAVVIPGYTEVFDLTVSGPEHNYVVGGLLCHNKTSQDDQSRSWYDERPRGSGAEDTPYFP
jgi:hypothetical protein